MCAFVDEGGTMWKVFQHVLSAHTHIHPIHPSIHTYIHRYIHIVQYMHAYACSCLVVLLEKTIFLSLIRLT